MTADPVLLGRLGARLSQPVPATGATMEGLSGSATWASTTPVRAVYPPAGSAMGAATAQAQTGRGALPISVRWAYGKGQVLGLGVDPMASGRTGYELLPTLSRLVGEATMAPAGPSRNGLELYLDPGVLPPNIERNVNAVAALAQGARVVDVAAWDTNFTDPSQDYPYAALIQALHARGILAYAWLEPPFVDLAMWQNQPQCREKTETGQDAHPYWRDLISLETPACFNLAWQQWTPVIEGNPWDGVNVAELYFESPQHPAAFTPFSPGALKLFGRDPRTNMAAFMKFRVQLVTELNGEMLTRLNSLPHASDLDLELTVIDSKLDPTEAYDVGSDVTQLAGVAQKGGASLELEDPFTTWSEGPLRYDQPHPRAPAAGTAGQRPDRPEHRESRRCPPHRQDDRRRAGPGGFQRGRLQRPDGRLRHRHHPRRRSGRSTCGHGRNGADHLYRDRDPVDRHRPRPAGRTRHQRDRGRHAVALSRRSGHRAGR